MGIPLAHPAVQQAIERGLIRAADLAGPVAITTAAEPEPQAAHQNPPMVAPVFAPPNVWLLPVITASETNCRDWRARSNRTKAARAAVSKAFGPHLAALAVFATHYHAGGALQVVLTRLGGRRLDRSNLPAALKATEDAVALILGCNDGDPRWRPEFQQEPGGLVGVRVELRVA